MNKNVSNFACVYIFRSNMRSFEKILNEIFTSGLSGFVVKMLEICSYDVTFPNIIFFGQFSKNVRYFCSFTSVSNLGCISLIVLAQHAPHFSKKI